MAAFECTPEAFDTVIFDAEPLIAYFLDEPGVDTVERFVRATERADIDSYASPVTVTEVFYVCHRASDRETALRYVESLSTNGIETIPATEVKILAGQFKCEHPMALGDAYTLATGWTVDEGDGSSTGILVGADDDYDPFVTRTPGDEEGVAVVRFRDGTA